MAKKKKKSKKTKKANPLNTRLFLGIGGLFHLLVYFFNDLTFYNDTLFWGSLVCCGLISGIYFIKKLKLLHSDSYKKKEGSKGRAYLFFISFLMLIGSTILFGNVINGTILGLNYLGKTKTIQQKEFKVLKIVQNKTGGRKSVRRNVPMIYLEKEGEPIHFNLKERYVSSEFYSEFKSIELNMRTGLFGFEIIDNYELKK